MDNAAINQAVYLGTRDAMSAYSEAQPTLRDQFAMAALTGIMAEEHKHWVAEMGKPSKYKQIASKAYCYADAMLKERVK